MAKVGNYTSTPRLDSYLVVLEQQKRYSKTPPKFALQPHRVGNSMEFLELGCLAGKLDGVAGVQLQSHAKHALK
jgi:hypothetical protein